MGQRITDTRLERLTVTLRLQRWIVDWLRDMPESQAKLVQDALIKAHNLEEPK